MDNVLVVSHDPKKVIINIVKKFEINNDKYGIPKCYQGVDMEKFRIFNSKSSRSMKCDTYMAAAVQTFQCFLEEDEIQIKSRKFPHCGPLTQGYNPELDMTDDCNDEHVSCYQQFIGVLN